MKVSIDSGTLLPALRKVRLVLQARPIVPIFGCVKMVAQSGELVLSGWGGDIMLTISVPAVVEQEGAVAVNGTQLAALDYDGRLTLELSEGKLLVLGKGLKCNYPAYPAKDYPQIPEQVNDLVFSSVPSEHLVPALKFAAQACDLKDVRSIGVILKQGEGFFEAAGCCSQRFHAAKVEVETETDGTFERYVPIGAVDTIAKALPAGVVELTASPNFLGLKCGAVQIETVWLDGKPYGYEKIFSNYGSGETGLSVDRLVLQSALRTLGGFVENLNVETGERITFTVNGESINAAINTSNGSCDVTVDGEGDGGSAVVSKTRLSNLMATMASVGDDVLHVRFEESVIYGRAGTGKRFLVMGVV